MRRFALTFLILLPMIVGCGGEKNVVAVSGVVYLDDKPLADAIVQFQPVGKNLQDEVGYASYGKTDGEGRFTLRLQHPTEDLEGAVIGEHRLTVSKMIPLPGGSDAGSSKETMPKYCSGVDTQLRVVIPQQDVTDLKIELYQTQRNKQPTGIHTIKP